MLIPYSGLANACLVLNESQMFVIQLMPPPLTQSMHLAWCASLLSTPVISPPLIAKGGTLRDSSGSLCSLCSLFLPEATDDGLHC